MCGQRYHTRVGIEENSKRKFRAYYGKEMTDIATKLQTGEFLYLNKNQLIKIRVPLFEPVTQPQEYREPEPENPESLIKRILGL